MFKAYFNKHNNQHCGLLSFSFSCSNGLLCALCFTSATFTCALLPESNSFQGFEAFSELTFVILLSGVVPWLKVPNSLHLWENYWLYLLTLCDLRLDFNMALYLFHRTGLTLDLTYRVLYRFLYFPSPLPLYLMQMFETDAVHSSPSPHPNGQSGL